MTFFMTIIPTIDHLFSIQLDQSIVFLQKKIQLYEEGLIGRTDPPNFVPQLWDTFRLFIFLRVGMQNTLLHFHNFHITGECVWVSPLFQFVRGSFLICHVSNLAVIIRLRSQHLKILNFSKCLPPCDSLLEPIVLFKFKPCKNI